MALFVQTTQSSAAGRAGRDGLPSECILYHAPRDIPRIMQLMRMGKGGRSKQFKQGIELLNKVRLELCGLQHLAAPEWGPAAYRCAQRDRHCVAMPG